MLGISTSWRSEIFDSGTEIIDSILELELRLVELEYRINTPMLNAILPLIKKGNIAVASLHNFFPTPDGVPRKEASGDVFSLSSLDREECSLALKHTFQTIYWAQELEAKAVVLHLGKIPMDSPMKALKQLYDDKKIESPAGQEFIEKELKKRADKSRAHLDSALRNLDKLANEAGKRSILLGVENRYNLEDFPNFVEFEQIFHEFKESPIRYWHDIGHATAQENLGIAERGLLLEHFSSYLAGLHLHGCKGHHDHYAPGSGDEDYSLLKKCLKPETIRIVETHHRATKEELVQGLNFLREQGF